MEDFVVLKDNDITDLLLNLSQPDILAFKQSLETSLGQFSTSPERHFQPSPSVVNRPNGQKTLFRAFTSPAHVGVKIIVDAAPDAQGKRQGLHGVLTVCDDRGIPVGIMNAEAVTGYRTSMSAIIPFCWRQRVDEVLVFGAGKQALWHLRLALALRGEEIRRVGIANRSRERAQGLVDLLREENRVRWKAGVEFEVLDGGDGSFAGVKKALESADVVFCTTPSTERLFDAGDLIGREKREAPLVTAIGSWQPQMIELDPALLRYVVEESHGYGGGVKGKVLVDDHESCLADTGEFIGSKLGNEDVVEIGEVINQKADSKHEWEEWLATRFVIYKSIGVGVTDLVSGSRILELAKERGLGTLVKGM